MQIHLKSPLDMHLHLREEEMLQRTAPLSSRSFAGAVIMPNLRSPVDSLKKLRAYREEIARCCGSRSFLPYMTLFFKNYSREELEEAREETFGLKLYPAGITTRSEAGVRDFEAIRPTLALMEELDLPLLVHGESHGFVLDREREFMDVYGELARQFPRLHIVMEHITTKEAITLLDQFDNLSATLTLHHLYLTLDDVVGGLMEPDYFCKPIAKRPEDREALCEAVLSGHPKIMFGSDSAPHPRHKKECCGCAAGIFTAPVALPMLAEFFEKQKKLELLQSFINTVACTRYKIEPPKKEVILEKSEWRVPDLYGNIKPFGAGTTLSWKVVPDTVE